MADKKYTVLVVKEEPQKVIRALEKSNLEVTFRNESRSIKKPKAKPIKKSTPAC